MAAGPPFILVVPSDLTCVPAVRQFVEGVCRAGGVDADSTDAIVLAANEAISNVIRHAHQGRADAQVHIECTLLEDGIEVTLADEGDPFDIGAVPDLDPSELRCGGRGVFLMRALLDVLECVPRRSGGNQLRMVRRRRQTNNA